MYGLVSLSEFYVVFLEVILSFLVVVYSTFTIRAIGLSVLNWSDLIIAVFCCKWFVAELFHPEENSCVVLWITWWYFSRTESADIS